MAQDLLTKTFMAMRANLFVRARRLLASDEEADDALQEAFSRLWTRRQTVASESHAAGLSATAVKNVCIDALRRRQAHLTVSIEDDAADIVPDSDDSSTEDLYAEVRSIIDRRLSERERRVLTMRDVMEMDFDEIAAELDISEANARLILSRARRAVREIYLSTHK